MLAAFQVCACACAVFVCVYMCDRESVCVVWVGEGVFVVRGVCVCVLLCVFVLPGFVGLTHASWFLCVLLVRTFCIQMCLVCILSGSVLVSVSVCSCVRVDSCCVFRTAVSTCTNPTMTLNSSLLVHFCSRKTETETETETERESPCYFSFCLHLVALSVFVRVVLYEYVYAFVLIYIYPICTRE